MNNGQLPALSSRSGFRLDVKTTCIGAIVLFLLVFNVWPMCYLVFRSFYTDTGFTLEAVKRIYTYPLNWSALRNTLVTAGFAMVFGVLIAFPLAWLVGRTDMYGKK
ncbi:MAG: iron ABC transporter permease, partial [Pyramidobacter sp.]|nr:iron ABC transporter permease [Pyramidobacter sp.]